jgi:hypothetical protein
MDATAEWCRKLVVQRGRETKRLRVITLAVFIVFAWITFREAPRWNEAVAMILIMAAVVVTFAFGPPRGELSVPTMTSAADGNVTPPNAR